ncbi:MAG: hypothetical protein EBU90_03225 [Proteobacteria bacterium]|nr:hypothetical protein [Pseudomonadota bacterium]NBP13338.1 hypothetical protein [bacterium]
MLTYKLFLEQSSTRIIGLFPGAFKPPHKGHFATALNAAKNNNDVFILVSSTDRDGISSTDSLTIWNIYKKYLPKNIRIYLIPGSPVLAIYQTVDILNNGKFSATQKAPLPMPVAAELAEEIKQTGNKFKINLYTGGEDAARFDAFQKNTPIYAGKDVIEIKQQNVSRIASATDARAALKEKNYDKFRQVMPDITKENKIAIYKMLVR